MSGNNTNSLLSLSRILNNKHHFLQLAVIYFLSKLRQTRRMIWLVLSHISYKLICLCQTQVAMMTKLINFECQFLGFFSQLHSYRIYRGKYFVLRHFGPCCLPPAFAIKHCMDRLNHLFTPPYTHTPHNGIDT